MALTEMPDFTFKHTAQVDKPNVSADTMKANFDSQAVAIREYLNTTLKTEVDAKAGTTDLTNLAGAGRTTETVKDNADAVADLAGTGRTTETVKGNADNLATHLADGAHQTVSVTDTTDATSSVNAPMKTAGGLGVAKKAYIGDCLYIGNSFYQDSIALKSVGSTDPVALATINMASNFKGCYVTLIASGIQQDVGDFIIKKTFALIRSTAITVNTDINLCWGASINQKDNVTAVVDGNDVIIKVSSRNTSGATYYNIALRVEGYFTSIAIN